MSCCSALNQTVPCPSTSRSGTGSWRRSPAASRLALALPSTRQLAVDLGVNFHTVNKGYDLLRQEGLPRLGREVRRGGAPRREQRAAPIQAGPRTGRACCGCCSPRPPPRACPTGYPVSGMPGRHGGFCLPRRGGGGGGRKRKRAMSAGSLSAYFTVPVVGALMCSAPKVTRPTVQFGVRVPRRTGGGGGHPAGTARLLLEVRGHRRLLHRRRGDDAGLRAWVDPDHPAAGGGRGRRLLLGRAAEDRRGQERGQLVRGPAATVVADTSWRTDPPRFPLRWLIPALAVMAATAVVGALRYPRLPAHIATGLATGRPRSPSASWWWRPSCMSRPCGPG